MSVTLGDIPEVHVNLGDYRVVVNTDYDHLDNRPKINNVVLTGNKTSANLGLANASHTHTISNISGLSSQLSDKQDVIDDLETIRSGAAAGAQAVQDAPADGMQYARKDNAWELVDAGSGVYIGTQEPEDPRIDVWINPEGNVDPYVKSASVSGKTLTLVKEDGSSLQFTYDGTSNYNELDNRPKINSVTLSGNLTAPDLGLVPESDLSAHVNDGDIHVTPADKTTWGAKQDAISDLDDIRDGASLGATSLQSHQDISGKVDKSAQAEKTDAMTQPVGIDQNGKLWALPGGSSGGFYVGDEEPEDTGILWIDTSDDNDTDMQTRSITDAEGYFTSDTVEGALAELGAEVFGLDDLIGSGVIE